MAKYNLDLEPKEEPTEELAPTTRSPKEPVVSGEVITKKKSWMQKFATDFFQGDSTDIREFLVKDVLEPKLRDLLSSAVNGAVDTLVYGPGSSPSRTSGKKKRSSILSGYEYNSIFDSDEYDSRGRRRNSRSRDLEDDDSDRDWNNLIFSDREDAVKVQMAMIIESETHQAVSIMDLCEFARIGKVANTYTHWGWTDISKSNTKIVRTHDGRWELKLPKARPL